jgi:hypothetical protein
VIEAGLLSVLENDAGVAAAVGDRLYHGLAPGEDPVTGALGGDAALPLVQLRRGSTRHEGRHYGGRSPAATAMLWVVCRDSTIEGARSLGLLVARALQAVIDDDLDCGPGGTLRCKRCDLMDQRDPVPAPRAGRSHGEAATELLFEVFYHDSETLAAPAE